MEWTGIMKRIAAVLLLAAWTAAFAQDPAAEEEAEVPAAPCVAADGAEAGEEGQETEDCEEEEIVEATVDEVFTPGQEISEDYPVPLPADI